MSSTKKKRISITRRRVILAERDKAMPTSLLVVKLKRGLVMFKYYSDILLCLSPWPRACNNFCAVRTARKKETEMAVTSMAAALAASLPAPSAGTVAPTPTYEAIPASMAKAIDIEAEIPLTCVQLDGMVCFHYPI